MSFTIAIRHQCDLPWNALSSRMMSTDYVDTMRGWAVVSDGQLGDGTPTGPSKTSPTRL